MDYESVWGIECGSTGMGGKWPEYCQERLEFCAGNSFDIMNAARSSVREHILSQGYLTDPKTRNVTARLLALSGPEGTVPFNKDKAVVRVSQQELLVQALANID